MVKRKGVFSGWSRFTVIACMLSLIFTSLPAALFAGGAGLSWVPPTANTDGTALTDLAGYKIYYGTASGKYSQSVTVGNVTTYTISNLTDGITYYFAATAYNASGVESGYSNEVSVTPAAQQYTLTIAKAGTGAGVIAGAGINCGTTCTGSYGPGTAVALTSTPDAGSTFAGWSGGGCSGTGPCVTTMNANQTITAAFNLNPATAATYTITASAGSGGSISPSGSITISQGASKTFTIKPWRRYNIAKVIVDGVSVGAVSTYTFSAVTANHVIRATFIRK